MCRGSRGIREQGNRGVGEENHTMKKIVLLIILFHSLCVYIFSSDYEPELDVLHISIDYGKTFNNEVRIINLELSLFPYSLEQHWTINFGLLSTFSPDKFIFDLYAFGGFIYFPFGRILSLTFGFGAGCSMYALLNHFPYLLNAKMNIDIPIDEFYNESTGSGVQHNLTIGMGVQHRNAVKLFGYIKSDSYYSIYNSYFFEVGYRAIIKSPPGTRPTH